MSWKFDDIVDERNILLTLARVDDHMLASGSDGS
jgi:hypothetical protein